MVNDIIEGISDAQLEGYISIEETRRRIKLLAAYLTGIITLRSLSNQFETELIK